MIARLSINRIIVLRPNIQRSAIKIICGDNVCLCDKRNEESTADNRQHLINRNYVRLSSVRRPKLRQLKELVDLRQ